MHDDDLHPLCPKCHYPLTFIKNIERPGTTIDDWDHYYITMHRCDNCHRLWQELWDEYKLREVN